MISTVVLFGYLSYFKKLLSSLKINWTYNNFLYIFTLFDFIPDQNFGVILLAAVSSVTVSILLWSYDGGCLESMV